MGVLAGARGHYAGRGLHGLAAGGQGMSKERPIIMTGESVVAILSGAKTQSRRVIKPQPATDLSWVTEWGWTFFTPDKHISGRGNHPRHGRGGETFLPCPYALGQRLWVRETWGYWGSIHTPEWLIYRADGDRSGHEWKSPLFMPRWASRLTLEITEVKVERVNEISEADAIAEGLAQWLDNEGIHVYYGINRADVWERDPRLTFKRLWDSINAKRGYPFDSGAWVWAIQFRRVTA